MTATQPTPVTITPSSPMTVMILGNGAQTSVEVI
jgi:hypothetical protein